jgi:hypothetical protein
MCVRSIYARSMYLLHLLLMLRRHSVDTIFMRELGVAAPWCACSFCADTVSATPEVRRQIGDFRTNV